jgi:hypothetical protein
MAALFISLFSPEKRFSVGSSPHLRDCQTYLFWHRYMFQMVVNVPAN